jgi:hypothetical protein
MTSVGEVRRGASGQLRIALRRAVLCIVILAALSRESNGNDIADIQKAILANRAAIKAWHVAISIHVDPNDGSQGEDTDSVTGLVSYCDGDFQRHEVTSRYLPSEQFPGLSANEYVDYLVWNDREVLFWSTQQFPSSKCAIRVTDRSHDPQANVAGALLFDVRWLGWEPQLDAHPQELFSNPRLRDWRVSDEEWQGIPCKKLIYRYDTGSYLGTLWVSPERGYSVLRHDAEYTANGQAGRLEGTFLVKEWHDSGIWYPETAIRESKDAAGKVLRREEMSFQVHSINERLDRSLFTVAALAPTLGTRVFFTPDDRQSSRYRFEWDGHEIVQVRESSAALQKSEAPSAMRWLLLANAFALTVICAVCMWRAFRQKPQT